ncbi:unnamed protein product [Ostreobium quekettii]|uniref:Uncharacterized protein n=1 Tax=Ostreobium quekettii TaxID=121088 RepID=A0A8S1ISZ2_9CHLO|nr:unnamed protein product [Ostreobium quekettii]
MSRGWCIWGHQALMAYGRTYKRSLMHWGCTNREHSSSRVCKDKCTPQRWLPWAGVCQKLQFFSACDEPDMQCFLGHMFLTGECQKDILSFLEWYLWQGRSRLVASMNIDRKHHDAPPWASELIRLLGAEDALEEAEKCAGSPLERLKSSSDVVIFALQGLKLNEAAAQVKRTLDTLSDGGPSRARMAVVDGSRVLCQPGPSISESLEVLLEVLHPEAQPFGHQGELWRSLGREMA